MSIVPNHQLQPLSNELAIALIEQIIDCCVIEQDDTAAKALTNLIRAVAGEEDKVVREMFALDVTAAIYSKTEAFHTAARAFADGARVQYQPPGSRRRTQDKGHLSRAFEQ